MARIMTIVAGAAVLASVTPVAACAQASEARRMMPDPTDPAWNRLNAMRAAADDLATSKEASAEAKAAAWQALYDEATAVQVGRGKTAHPLAGAALTALAIAQSERGEATAAVEKLRRSVAILAPYREAYAPDYASAVGVLAQTLSGMLGQSTEALQILGDSDTWYAAYLAKRPADRRSVGEFEGEAALAIAYGEVLSDLGRNVEAARYKLAYWEAQKRVKGPYHPDTNAGHWAYATELFLAGQSEEAERHARDAVQIAIDHISPSEATFAQSFNALAILLVRRGKRHEALDYIRRSIEIRRATLGADDVRLYGSLFNLGDVLTALERYEEADRALLEAARGWRAREGASSVRSAIAFARAGIVEYADGHVAQAADRMNAALTSARAADPKEQRIGSLVQPLLSLAHHELGRTDEGRRLAELNLAFLRSQPQPYPIELAVAELTAAYLTPGGPGSAAARAAARRVIEIERSNRDIVASGDLAQGDRTAIELALRVAVAANDTQLALDAMVVLAGSKIAQANRLVTERLVTADPKLAARIREQQDAARAFKMADTALLKAMAVGAEVADARRKRDDAAARVATIRTALMRDYPNWTDASGVSDPDLTTVQGGLGTQEAVLAIVPAFDGVYTLLVTQNGARVRRTPLGRKAVSDLVGRLRVSLPTGAFDTQAAHLLYRQFFPQVDADLLHNVTSLRVVPAGIFAALPFDTLLERPVARLDARAPYLIRRFAITVAPSVAPVPRRPSVAAIDGRFLGIGAPTQFGAKASPGVRAARSYFRAGKGNAEALAALPALPGSATEIARVARRFGPGRTKLLVGDDASEVRLKTLDLKRYSTILFATHGLVSGEVEGVIEPALVLARPQGDGDGDGLLTASEVAALTLDADWVILSACNTAAGEAIEAPAYSGLAQAFRYAGARTLLLSHWPVRDDAAAFVTIETIANARKGMRRDVARQRAVLKLMAMRTIAGAADPYVWAPYILLGESGG